ncbi:UvrD-helicase domain-containing protein [Nakamurella sp.]|uniref:UvrD-helicase domain-containing protein n=1 Tax=Nakamurella sp. TaxID=1869182 RepID=UPI003782D571
MSDPGSTPGGAPTGAPVDPIVEEQAAIDELYRRLDDLRTERIELRDRYISRSDNTPGGRVERDLAYANHAAAVVALNAAEDRLCFGRIDRTDGESMHIGRMGIFADAGDHRQLLMDWRAPSARPFYVATAANPLGLRRRRYITTRRRRVLTANDEYLDLTDRDALAQAQANGGGPAGEAALLAALRAPRTGRMSDIVATIQAEQDRIIRAELNGILVVQGGPGTGKTAVALHRAAYLLYNHREQLQQRGVLIIGPNPTFLDYIGQVLPSLGENAVVLSTVADLFPGVSAQAVERPEVARVKGRTSMTTVIANAVLHRQALPKVPIEVPFEGAPGGRLTIGRSILGPARDRAWASRRPHNRARPLFVRRVIDGLVRQVAARLGTGPDGESLATADDLAAIRQDLIEHEGLRDALRGVWPTLTPQRLLADLFGSAERIEFAAESLRQQDRERLLRTDEPAAWTVADVPLLDEAAESLGVLDAAAAAAAVSRSAEDGYAAEVLDLLGANDDLDPEDVGLHSMVGMVNAATLAGLHEEVADWTSTAERAAADREWTYGHVIVDEAQELSAMAWRMVMRRCPMRSMTLVGDLAQTSDPAGASSWSRMLRQYVRGRFGIEELTVNYRTPAEIMTVAEPVLSAIDPELRAPRSVRDTGVWPAHRRVASADLAAQVVDVVRDEDDEPGTVAVIVPRSRFAAVAGAVERARTGGPAPASESPQPSLFEVGEDVTDLRRHVVVLTVPQVKGLEFDSVIVADPAGIIGESDRGLSDLYVALTRTTQRLTVLHTGDLPAVLGRLREPAA